MQYLCREMPMSTLRLVSGLQWKIYTSTTVVLLWCTGVSSRGWKQSGGMHIFISMLLAHSTKIFFLKCKVNVLLMSVTEGDQIWWTDCCIWIDPEERERAGSNPALFISSSNLQDGHLLSTQFKDRANSKPPQREDYVSGLRREGIKSSVLVQLTERESIYFRAQVRGHSSRGGFFTHSHTHFDSLFSSSYNPSNLCCHCWPHSRADRACCERRGRYNNKYSFSSSAERHTASAWPLTCT